VEFFVGVAAKPGAQILFRLAGDEVAAQQALDRLGNMRGEATVADGAGDGSVLADGSAEAEVIRVGELAFVLDLLAFDSDVGDPVLAATIRASSDVEAELLIELREALFEFTDEPAGEALGLSDGQLAELSAGAGDGAAPEGRAFDIEADFAEFGGEGRDFLVGDVDEEQILRDCGAQCSRAVAVGEIGGGFELFSGETAAEHRCADVAEARRALGMDAGVVAQYVIWDVLGMPGSRVKSRRDWSSARKDSAVQPSFMKRYLRRARSRLSRRPCWSRKISVTARTT